MCLYLITIDRGCIWHCIHAVCKYGAYSLFWQCLRTLSCDGMFYRTRFIAVITIASFFFERPLSDHNRAWAALLTIAEVSFRPSLGNQSEWFYLISWGTSDVEKLSAIHSTFSWTYCNYCNVRKYHLPSPEESRNKIVAANKHLSILLGPRL